jgi:hypothetical protein
MFPILKPLCVPVDQQDEREAHENEKPACGKELLRAIPPFSPNCIF